ncbi:hypothetical protein OA2633_00295 [Oceanicaulis sp. HTCC2633]|uniref:hypothetical protein n=1 Tax=Oceanicaulis sp. HTCC2633 TaxID=314254 RepID=UPI0000669A4C|nr:hypothetical protein [Oceanicaulis sp. HTCC2633]EAP89186.1 hypothetical protein OA2633_00295 [Oceanicaulis sp. HTCC2633]
MLGHAIRVGESLLVLFFIACLFTLLGWGGWAIALTALLAALFWFLRPYLWARLEALIEWVFG